VSCTEIIDHFRFVHHLDHDQIMKILLEELGKLDERVTNLCELLEVREK
jgi:hypothetical protein